MFISYAQNFEDVILNRLFADKETGFYIDIGAQHPLYDSVTKAFYDRGWQGINIEPVKEYYQILQQARERDINLNLAIGEAKSELEFYELESTGLSTFDYQMALEIAEKDGYKINTYQVPVETLADICQQNVNQTIDFLKIDVEGWEENVILGHDWVTFRPIIVLLEATIPNSPVRTETNIRQILENQSYEYVYFDGLNDYYLATENSDLKQHFETPPNVFDKFITYRTIEAQNHSKNLESIIKSKELEINSATEQIEQKETELANQEREISNLTSQIQSKDAEIINSDRQFKQKERELHIINNKYQDRFFEIERLTQHLAKQQENHRQENDRLIQQLNQLQIERSQALQLVTAMETSKFWKLRSNWFKFKQILGKS